MARRSEIDGRPQEASIFSDGGRGSLKDAPKGSIHVTLIAEPSFSCDVCKWQGRLAQQPASSFQPKPRGRFR
jgi:hypothetical protein